MVDHAAAKHPAQEPPPHWCPGCWAEMSPGSTGKCQPCLDWLSRGRRCGRGHDLTIEANVVRHAGRQPECRICKAASNARYNMRQVVHHTCEDCGMPKHADKRRTCGPCRWKAAQIRKIENPRGAVLRETVDQLVALECEPPWVRAAAKKAREQAEAEMRAALRSVVTGNQPTESRGGQCPEPTSQT